MYLFLTFLLNFNIIYRNFASLNVNERLNVYEKNALKSVTGLLGLNQW